MVANTRERRQSVTTGFQQYVGDATAAVPTLDADEAIAKHGESGVVFVDVRDAPEQWDTGTIPDSVHASRGMLEFHIDPESPFAMEAFETGREFVFVCSLGARSALAAQRAAEMGLHPVASVEGGIAAWEEAGGPMEGATPRM